MLWAKNSAYYGSVATFVLAIGILFKNIDEPRYALMLVINSWVILTVLIAIFTRKMHFNQTMDVFKQVLLYKADEQWISLSKDSFEMIDARLQKPFIQVLKARGIGLFSDYGDGNDVTQIHETLKVAVDQIRAGKGPRFIEFSTYRWKEHCGPNFDNNIGYRSEEEFMEWKKRDPINIFQHQLKNCNCID